LARAKQTNRADARRRYRQTIAQPSDLEPEAGENDEPAATPTRAAGKPAARPSSAAQPVRPGVRAAFKGAYRPAHYREDLAALPQLVRGRWFLISLAVVAVGLVGSVLIPSSFTALLQSLLALPVGGPTLPIFLVGFTAPRASYLLGGLVGLFDLVLWTVVAVAAPSLVGSVDPQTVVVNGAIYGLPTAVVFAAAAAWYKRFLALSNAGRPRPSGSSRSKSSGRSAARR
jgi:hypothetical protein